MRFHIRDLIWLTLLAAFAASWYVDRGRLVQETVNLERQRTVLVQQLADMKRLALVERVLQDFDRKWKADEDLENRMRTEILDESTQRYLKAVRDTKGEFHYPVIDRP